MINNKNIKTILDALFIWLFQVFKIILNVFLI